jgi:PAS domain S-box-containing protein
MSERLDSRSNLDKLRELQYSLESTERELALRDALLAAIVENASDAIIARDLNGTVIVWNKSAEKLYGWTADEMIGHKIFRIVPEDKREEHREWIARAEEGQTTGPLKTERIAKDGSRLYIVISVSPIVARSGEILGASAIEHEDLNGE